MRRGKEDRFRDAAPRGLVDELRRRGYDVDDKSPTEIVRLIMEGELRKRVPTRSPAAALIQRFERDERKKLPAPSLRERL